MDINSLIYLGYIVEEGSFQAAANKLGIPKSSLSRHINSLEKSMGVQLLNRTTRSLSLTEIGAQIFPSCQKLMEEYQHVLDITHDANSEPRGNLRITAPITAGRIFLADWLARFSRQNPKIVLDVHFTDQEEDLVSQRFDIAIRVGALHSSTLISRPFASTPRILIASPEFLSNHRIHTVKDLENAPLISFSHVGVTGNLWRLFENQKPFKLTAKPTMILNDMTAALEAASAGGGVALAPAFVANEYIRNHRLQQVLPNISGEHAQFHIVYLRRDNLPGKTRIAIEFILQQAKENSAIFNSIHTET